MPFIIFALLVAGSMDEDVSLLVGQSVCPFAQPFRPGQDVVTSAGQTLLNSGMDINGHHRIILNDCDEPFI